MEVKAILRYARITPRKMRLVGDLCRGLSVDQAEKQLQHCQRRGGKLLTTLLRSAIANAKEKGGVDTEHLYVKNVYVDDGPTLKRFMPRAMGRAYPILKKMSHVTVVLDEAR